MDATSKVTIDRGQANLSSDKVFAQEQYGQSGIQKARVWREEKEQELQNQFKQSQTGNVVRTSIASGARGSRTAGRWVGKKLGSKRIGAKVGNYAAARVKVSAANAWIVSWVMFWYVTIQLPFAVVSAVGIGTAAVVYNMLATLDPTTDNAILSRVVEGAVQTGSVLKWILEFALARFGIDYDPILLFAIPFFLLFSLGLLQLVLCWFIYSLLGIKSLSGKFSSAKVATFILAAAGTAVPILNLFPLILIWTLVVWLKPQ